MTPTILHSFLSPSLTTLLLTEKMAGAHCATSTSTISFVTPTPFRKALVISSISNPSNVKFSRRRNYLRPKIFKTLRKRPMTPSSPIETLTDPQIPIESQEIETRPTGSEEIAIPPTGHHQIEDSENSSGSLVVSNVLNKVEKFSGKLMLKLGLSLVGIFVVQTVVAVWIGLSNSSNKEENFSEGEKVKRNLLQNGSTVGRKEEFNNEAELEKKIVEIREMAREARDSEKKNEKSNEDEELKGVEKEVSTRLVNLKKKLSSDVNKKSERVLSSVSSLGKSNEKEGGGKESDLSPIEGKGALMFKKKRRFRSSGVDEPRNSPKGFTGPGYDGSVIKDVSSGVVARVGNGSENVGTSIKSAQVTSQRSTLVGRQSVAGKLSNQQLDKQKEVWWFKLPYVLGILMRRSSNPEEPGGLYTLRNDADDRAYTIAFEDRGEANNFCYLLETFFEDLGDFSVDIVPLPVKDLLEEAKSHTMKWIVVRKGQLQLYAGQALDEVETKLRSLAN